MNTSEIEKILTTDQITKNFFIGCFPSDRLPELTFYPHCFVANVLASDEPSTRLGHWICVYVKSANFACYYDSLNEPVHPNIALFLKKFSVLEQNKRSFQSGVSTICGFHVIYVLLNLCKGTSLPKICLELSKVKIPDLYVYYFVKKRYKLPHPIM